MFSFLLQFELSLFTCEPSTLQSMMRPFCCPSCSRSFTRRDHLIRHQVTKHEAVRTACILCGITTSRKDHMLRHLRIKHKFHCSPLTNESASPSKSLQHFLDNMIPFPINVDATPVVENTENPLEYNVNGTSSQAVSTPTVSEACVSTADSAPVLTPLQPVVIDCKESPGEYILGYMGDEVHTPVEGDEENVIKVENAIEDNENKLLVKSIIEDYKSNNNYAFLKKELITEKEKAFYDIDDKNIINHLLSELPEENEDLNDNLLIKKEINDISNDNIVFNLVPELPSERHFQDVQKRAALPVKKENENNVCNSQGSPEIIELDDDSMDSGGNDADLGTEGLEPNVSNSRTSSVEVQTDNAGDGPSMEEPIDCESDTSHNLAKQESEKNVCNSQGSPEIYELDDDSMDSGGNDADLGTEGLEPDVSNSRPSSVEIQTDNAGNGPSMEEPIDCESDTSHNLAKQKVPVPKQFSTDSYCRMIIRAILSSPGRCISLKKLLSFISENYPYLSTSSGGWQASFKDYLCRSNHFVKDFQRDSETGSLKMWILNPVTENQIIARFNRGSSEKIQMDSDYFPQHYFPCPDCGLKYKRKDHLKRHQSTIHKARLKCHVCGTKYGRSKNLKRHLQYIHGYDATPSPPKAPAPTLPSARPPTAAPSTVKITAQKMDPDYFPQRCFPCLDCGLEYKRKDNLKRHQSTIHKARRLVCHVCGAKYVRRNKLKRHLQYIHGYGATPSSPKAPAPTLPSAGPPTAASPTEKITVQKVDSDYFPQGCFPCLDCGLKFKRKHHLTRHQSTIIHWTNRLVCHVCGEKYSQRNNLKHHLQYIHGYDATPSPPKAPAPTLPSAGPPTAASPTEKITVKKEL